jgi:YfiH family protein
MNEDTLTDSNFYWREKGAVKILVCRALEDAGFVNGFSTRLGGISPLPTEALSLSGFDQDEVANIEENRRRFFDALGVSHKLACVRQVHGEAIVRIFGTDECGDLETPADGMISDAEGVILGSKTADCVPVLIGDPRTGAFAAVHAGWRGTVRSIAMRAVERMKSDLGADPNDMIAAIGPAASGRSYEVGEDVMEEFRRTFPDCENLFDPTREGHALIDLHLANAEQLVTAGLRHDNIHVTSFCTMESSDLFFSHRVDSGRYGKTGRLLAVIGKK